MTLRLSILDLVPVGAGTSPAAAIRATATAAQLAERLGYVRYWLAEHHNNPTTASSTPDILISHVASRTRRIRVGSGGIMLPNHPTLRVAEAFHTLHVLHPGRIDLGVGRAAGTDPATAEALCRSTQESLSTQITDLLGVSSGRLAADHRLARVRVVPEGVTLPPIWLLGSSGASAALAGSLGLGYAIAHQPSTRASVAAINAYRNSFAPSQAFPVPQVILAVSVVCARSGGRAQFLASSLQLSGVRVARGELGPLPSAEEASRYPYDDAEHALASEERMRHIIGDPGTVHQHIMSLAAEARADEVMINCNIADTAARFEAYELVAAAFGLSSIE